MLTLRTCLLFLLYFYTLENVLPKVHSQLNLKSSRVWGPGLIPDKIVMPARYFFVRFFDTFNKSTTEFLENHFHVAVDGGTKSKKPCRIWTTVLDRKDGSYIVRYKVYETCSYIKINLLYNDEHVAESPYMINNVVYPDDCLCPFKSMDAFIKIWNCGLTPTEITEKLKVFGEINWDSQRNDLIEKFNKPHSVSLCHYIVKNNEIHRKCYGKYVGFNMFMDNILLSLVRKLVLPNLEFFVNLGDWPLSTYDLSRKYPILSWCGSTDSYDIVMPTYDITESTLENMGRVMLDILSVQGNVEGPWESRKPKLFWRGRDSNRQRLDLITISREYPELFNVSLTNFFFYRDEEDIYGPKSDYVSFFRFFDYKYQLATDGTVAPYRMPYLLGGGSLIFKPNSKYFEHFYNDIIPDVHYISVKQDLSNLVQKVKWAIENDSKAKEIALNGQIFANENLLPRNIICYHVHLLKQFSKIIKSKVNVLDDMEHIKQTKLQHCDCSSNNKDEL